MIEVAIDNSQDSSMALAIGNELYSKDKLNFGRSSDSDFLPCLIAFLTEHSLKIQDVEGWTVGLGPGSFAGIRFSLALVKGICTATKAKMRGINSSFAMALATGTQGKLAIVQDARCGKAFVSIYDNGKPAPPVMLDINGQWPENTRCNACFSPDDSMVNALPALAVRKIDAPSARFLLNANEQLWPWAEGTDIEPVYVRQAVC